MKRTSQNRFRAERGFTLIEMVIVAVVIGVISAMAVPSFLSYMPKLRVKSAARDIVSQMRLARSRSVAERKPYGVYFDLVNNRYVVFADTDNPAGLTYTVADSLIKADTLRSDVSLMSCTYTNSCVIFNSTGAASTSGDLKVVTGDGSTLMSINALASTGRIRLTEVGS